MSKRALWTLLAVLLAVLVAAILWVRGNFDSLVKRAIVHYGSAITQVDVTVSDVEIDTANGRGRIRGLVVGNPRGFRTPYAFKADDIEVVIDVTSLTRDVVVVKKIAVLAPDVIYEQSDKSTNFDAIQKNISDGLGLSQAPPGGKPRKLIVQDFSVRNARAQGSSVHLAGKSLEVELPDIQLHDIGKGQGGVTPAELGQIISTAVTQRLVAAFTWDRLKKSVSNGLEKAGNAIKGFFQGKP